ncbi:hypothetical protein SprV_0802569000 [Sparganum proliferum]
MLCAFLLIHLTHACGRGEPDYNPRDLTAVALTPTKVRLSWKPPTSLPMKRQLFFVLKNQTRIRMVNETNLTIENLTPHTKYEFGVQTVLANYDYVRPGVFLTAATDELTDLSPSNLTAQVLNPNTIRFSWKPPRLQPDKATLYYLLQNGTRRKWTSGTSVELQGFSPHTTYEFCLQTSLSNFGLVEPGACVTANTDEISLNKSFSLGHHLWLSLLSVISAVMLYL